MPRRHPQPFWREFTNCWYAQLGGIQIKLHPDREEAFRLYHALMDRQSHVPEPAQPAEKRLVVEDYADLSPGRARASWACSETSPESARTRRNDV